jgi:hypothetical protein
MACRTGHRWFRLSQWKNAERKKQQCSQVMSLPVSIPLSDSISVLKVSVPLDLISYKVSIPLSAITETPVKSLATLRSRVKLTEALPPGWLDVNELEGLRDHLTFCKLSCNSTSGNPQVGFSVRVCEDFTWTVLVGGRQLQPSNCAMLIDLPRSLVTGIFYDITQIFLWQ